MQFTKVIASLALVASINAKFHNTTGAAAGNGTVAGGSNSTGGGAASNHSGAAGNGSSSKTSGSGAAVNSVTGLAALAAVGAALLY